MTIKILAAMVAAVPNHTQGRNTRTNLMQKQAVQDTNMYSTADHTPGIHAIYCDGQQTWQHGSSTGAYATSVTEPRDAAQPGSKMCITAHQT
jgi:hypothetical protein